jgi:hypothetical protein
MPFVKLDTSILDSTLWLDTAASRVFITALCMAQPYDLAEPMAQLEVRSLKPTGFVVPAGWYGFIAAAGIGIIRRSMLGDAEGYAALEALGRADSESRSPEFEGRRLVRVDGGYIVLNFMKFRDRDYGAADRMRRLRERKKSETVTPNAANVRRNVTQAECRGQRAVLTAAPLSAASADDPLTAAQVVGKGKSAEPLSSTLRVEHPPSSQNHAKKKTPFAARIRATPEEYVEFWDANRGPFWRVRKLKGKRLAKLKARIREGLTPAKFAEAVAKLKASDFCQEEFLLKHKSAFDFIVTKDNSVRLREGNYDKAEKPKPAKVFMRDMNEVLR